VRFVTAAVHQHWFVATGFGRTAGVERWLSFRQPDRADRATSRRVGARIRFGLLASVAVVFLGCSDPLPRPQANSVEQFKKIVSTFPQSFNLVCAASAQELNAPNPLFPFPPGAITATYVELDSGSIKYDVVRTKSLVTPHNGVINAIGSLEVKELKVPSTNAALIMELGMLLGSIDRDRQRLTQSLAHAQHKKLREESEIYTDCTTILNALYNEASSKKGELEGKQEHWEMYQGAFQFHFAFQNVETVGWSWVPLRWSFAGKHTDAMRPITRSFGPALMKLSMEAGDVSPDKMTALEHNRKESQRQRQKLAEAMRQGAADNAAIVADIKYRMESVRLAETEQISDITRKKAALASALGNYVFPSGAVFQDKILPLSANWATQLFPPNGRVHLKFWDSQKTSISHAITFDDGVFHGATAHFFENARTLKTLLSYDRGNRHGALRVGNEDGTPSLYQEYSNGMKQGFGCKFADNKPHFIWSCKDGNLVEAAKVVDYEIVLMALGTAEFDDIKNSLAELELAFLDNEQSLRKDLSGWYRDLVQQVRQQRASARSAAVREGNLAAQAAARGAASAQHRALLEKALRGQGPYGN